MNQTIPKAILVPNETYKVPSFRVATDGIRVETLEHCFIAHMLLDITNPPTSLKSSTGGVYTAVYDNLILPDNLEVDLIRILVSFQKHSYGSFAVIRNYREGNRKPRALEVKEQKESND